MSSDYRFRKFTVVPYDPKWKDNFASEAKSLRSIFGKEALSVEHIGSTAVPGLAGKPTIDILILVNDVHSVDALNKTMEAAGYKLLGEYVMPATRLFVKEADNIRFFNVHVFGKDHPHAAEMMNLRDYFCSHPEAVREYSQLKSSLFKRYPNNYALYRKHKDEWIEKLKEKIKHDTNVQAHD